MNLSNLNTPTYCVSEYAVTFLKYHYNTAVYSYEHDRTNPNFEKDYTKTLQSTEKE